MSLRALMCTIMATELINALVTDGLLPPGTNKLTSDMATTEFVKRTVDNIISIREEQDEIR